MRLILRTMLLACALATTLAAVESSADAVIPIADFLGSLAVNPVTNRIYVVGDSAAPKLFEIDGASHAIRSVSLPGTPYGRLAVDPLHNRIYFAEGLNLSVVDGRTLTLQNIAIGPAYDIAIDPGANLVWIGHNGTVTRIDGATLATQTLTPSPGIHRLAIDPIARRIYVSGSGQNLVEIDEVTLATRTLVTTTDNGFGPLAVDPLSQTLYAVGFDEQFGVFHPRLWVVDTAAFVTEATPFMDINGDENSVSALGADPVHARIWVQSPRIFSGCPGELFALSTTTFLRVPGSDVTSPAGCYISGWSLNPATNRVYGGNSQNFGFPPSEIAILDADVPAAAVPYTLPSPYDSLGVVAVNPATNRVYAVASQFFNFGSDNALIEFNEAEVAPVPIMTTITSDPPGSTGAIVVHFDAVSGFAPNPLPIRQIYYQVDAIDGPWLAASPAGATASAALSGLSPGAHVVYAFAVDGQEAKIGDAQNWSPIVGATASHGITAPASPACSNGLDDDGDGFVDYPSDLGCKTPLTTLENPECNNGVDDDGDLAIDHPADLRCRAAWDNDEATDPSSCGIGAELALVFAAFSIATSRVRRPRR